MTMFGWAARSGFGFFLGAAAASAVAQANWREVAVPLYGVDAYARGEALSLDARAARFDAASRLLTATLTGYCDGDPKSAGLAAAKAQWGKTAAAWDALSAMSTGPLIERHSARSIDFMPPRQALLARAVASAPKNAADMERIGAPARGIPALELLLWPTVHVTLQSDSPECDYARMLAADIEREAHALSGAAHQRAENRVENEEALARLIETINQWVGGVEQLRWAYLRKPLDVAMTRGGPPDFPRRLSGQAAVTWAVRWQTLRDTAVLGDRPVPQPGEAQVPFESLLRGRGLNPLADKLVSATAKVDRSLRGLRPDAPGRIRAAAQALGELTALAQEQLAPALDVRMGFSDADGD